MIHLTSYPTVRPSPLKRTLRRVDESPRARKLREMRRAARRAHPRNHDADRVWRSPNG